MAFDKLQEAFWSEELTQGCDALITQDLEAAERWLESAAHRARQCFPYPDLRLADSLFHLARLCHVQGKAEKGALLDRSAYDQRLQLLGPDADGTRESSFCVALFGIRVPTFDDQPLIERALQYSVEKYGKRSWQTFRLQGLLWALDHQAGRGDASQLYGGFKTGKGAPAPDEWGRLGDLACELKAWKDAAVFYERSLRDRTKEFGKESLAAVQTMAGLAQTQLHLGQRRVAEATLKRCLEILEEHHRGDPLRDSVREYLLQVTEDDELKQSLKPAATTGGTEWIGFGLEEEES